MQKISNVNCLVDVSGEGEQCKMFHVNMLKPYFDQGSLVLWARGGRYEFVILGKGI